MKKCLSGAFILFTMSLFLTVALQVILRHDDPACELNSAKHELVKILIFFVSFGLIVGFILLMVVLILIGEKWSGAIGIIVLGLIIILFGVYLAHEQADFPASACVVSDCCQKLGITATSATPDSVSSASTLVSSSTDPGSGSNTISSPISSCETSCVASNSKAVRFTHRARMDI